MSPTTSSPGATGSQNPPDHSADRLVITRANQGANAASASTGLETLVGASRSACVAPAVHSAPNTAPPPSSPQSTELQDGRAGNPATIANRKSDAVALSSANKSSERRGFFSGIPSELPIFRDVAYLREDLRQRTRAKETKNGSTDPSNNKSADSPEGLSRWGKCVNVASDLVRLAIGGGAVVGGGLLGIGMASLVTASAPFWLSGGLAIGGAVVAYCWLASPLSDLVHVIASSIFSPGAWESSSRFHATGGKVAEPSSAGQSAAQKNCTIDGAIPPGSNGQTNTNMWRQGGYRVGGGDGGGEGGGGIPTGR